jgi:GntR family negative regulator for fad regulon and positive regulator of fabA
MSFFLLDKDNKLVHNRDNWSDHLPVVIEMNNWTAPQRPNTYAEKALITAILDGTFPPGSTLPGERTLAIDLGVTRPTLREALQRLARDGWLTVRQGKATVVNDFWQEGGLNVLNALVHHGDYLPPNFVTQLLEVRLNLAPAYTKAAVERAPAKVSTLLLQYDRLDDTPTSFAAFDWQLHRDLTIASGNQIYTLILNGFSDFYEKLARLYFTSSTARDASRQFYATLAQAAANQDADLAERVSRAAMLESIESWQQVNPWGK